MMELSLRRSCAAAAATQGDGRLAGGVVRFRVLIALAWLAASAVLIPLADRLKDALPVTATIAGGQSAAVTKALSTRFGSPFTESVALVVTGIPNLRSPDGARLLTAIVERVSTVPGVGATLSYLDARDPFFISDDGTGAIVVVGLEIGSERLDSIMRELRRTSDAVADELRAEAPKIALRWTGESVLNHDIRAVSEEGAKAAELRALPLTFAALVVAFGTVAAALLPLAIGVLAIPLALGVAASLIGLWPMSAVLVNVVTMIGLALSIDYALLIVDRFRRAREGGCDAKQAAVEAARHSGHTVVVSGVSVAVGFAALLAVPVDELRSVAIGGLLATVVAVLLATILLPGVLSWLGAGVELGRLRRRPAGQQRGHGWLRWGCFVIRHPIVVLLVAGLPVALLATQAHRVRLELPRIEWMPGAAESTHAVHDLREIGRGGVADTVRLVFVTPPEVGVVDAAGWRGLKRLSAHLADDPRIERVTSLASVPGADLLGPHVVDRLPDRVLRSLLSRSQHEALLEVVPSRDLQPYDVSHLVRAIRSMDTAATTGVTNARVLVGGLPAFQVEYEDAIADSSLLVVGLVLLGTLAALMVGFRSVLVPIKALALNVVSVAAGLGALVLVFQDGYGTALFGLAGPAGAVYPALPPLVFCAVFGLSMDYEVFFVARVAELRRGGLADREALAEALARTGSLITGAAAVMIIVFAAFALQDFLLMKMLGFTLAVTVFIDATLVRMAIGPALLRLAGRWNWWPGDRLIHAGGGEIGGYGPAE
jgi:RND superfamily putative drug exporter